MSPSSPGQREPAWPRNVEAPSGAPNVIVFLTDDVGFGACSTFGGPIATPRLDELAAGGIRYNQFHTTAMCSPTRASLLTGRDPHRVGMGRVASRPTYLDGYTSVIPKSAGTLPEILRQNGYATGMFGKGHVTPEWEMSPVGPFDRWPTGLGFEYFYGFLGFDTNMWAPNLVENTSLLEPEPLLKGRHFEEIMADRAISWVSQQKSIAPNKPFFIYYATGTAHTPHHAPKEWLEKYRGAFDMGWDKVREETFARQVREGIVPPTAQLTLRPSGLEAWDTLSPERKKAATWLMEAYAAALSYVDFQIGRLFDYLRAAELFDNTLILFVQGDNGGSAEGGFNGNLYEQNWTNGYEEDLDFLLANLDKVGGPKAYNHFPAAWGWAMNTPFQYYKQVASHFGGTRNGLVLSWPRRVPGGGNLRTQFHHVSDVMPTVLEAAGVTAPSTLNGHEQMSVDGISMVYSFDGADVPARRTRQIFECLENCAYFEDGWMVSTTPVEGAAWSDLATRPDSDQSAWNWELYDISTDYSQSRDLSAEKPEKLSELTDRFWKAADAGKILPIHLPGLRSAGRPSLAAGRSEFRFLTPLRRVHQDGAPNTVGRSFLIEADLEVGDEEPAGVIVCHGSSISGYSLYLEDGKPAFIYNAVPPKVMSFKSDKVLGPGRHAVSLEFRIDKPVARSGGEFSLSVDGEVVGGGRVERTLRTFSNQDGFSVACDSVSPVSPDYTIATSELTCRLHKLDFFLR